MDRDHPERLDAVKVAVGFDTNSHPDVGRPSESLGIAKQFHRALCEHLKGMP